MSSTQVRFRGPIEDRQWIITKGFFKLRKTSFTWISKITPYYTKKKMISKFCRGRTILTLPPGLFFFFWIFCTFCDSQYFWLHLVYLKLTHGCKEKQAKGEALGQVLLLVKSTCWSYWKCVRWSWRNKTFSWKHKLTFGEKEKVKHVQKRQKVPCPT